MIDLESPENRELMVDCLNAARHMLGERVKLWETQLLKFQVVNAGEARLNLTSSIEEDLRKRKSQIIKVEEWLESLSDSPTPL